MMISKEETAANGFGKGRKKKKAKMFKDGGPLLEIGVWYT